MVVKVTPDLRLVVGAAVMPLTVDQSFSLAKALLKAGTRRIVLDAALPAKRQVADTARRIAR